MFSLAYYTRLSIIPTFDDHGPVILQLAMISHMGIGSMAKFSAVRVILTVSDTNLCRAFCLRTRSRAALLGHVIALKSLLFGSEAVGK